MARLDRHDVSSPHLEIPLSHNVAIIVRSFVISLDDHGEAV
jgi:hypothetical protein